jgi:hypothetical protein
LHEDDDLVSVAVEWMVFGRFDDQKMRRYERKTSFRHRESGNLGNWGLGQGYAKSLDNDGIMKFRR